MTIRLMISLPDDIHAQLVRVGAESHVSAAAVVRTILSDVLPKITGVLEYMITMPVTTSTVAEVDAWTRDMRGMLQTAPDAFKPFRHMLDEVADEGGES